MLLSEAEGHTGRFDIARKRTDLARSETSSTCGHLAFGNREIPRLPVATSVAGRIGKSKDSRR